jgi:hypothetical protein
MNRRLDRLEREFGGGGEPRATFTIHAPPPNLSKAAHAVYVLARGPNAFTLDLGAAGLNGADL